MAGKYGSASIWFLVDGYNMIAAKIQSLRYKVTALNEESHGAGDGFVESTPVGVSNVELAQEGAYFDTSSGNSHAALSGSVPNSPQTTPRVSCFGFATSAIGQPFAGVQGAHEGSYDVVAERGKLQRANAAFTVTGKLENGVVLHALTTETADANTEATSVDNTADTTQIAVAITSSSVANPSVITTAVPHNLTTGDTVLIAGHSGSTPTINGERTVTVISATTFSIPVNVTVGGTGGSFTRGKTNNGGSAYLQVTALTLGTFTGFLVTVRHSDDNVTFVDLVAFTTRTLFGAERVTVAGAVRRYLAQNCDFQGAGSGGSATYLAGFARN